MSTIQLARLLCSLALLGLISGCRPQVVQPLNEDLLMPLRVGNVWTWMTTSYGGGHNDYPRSRSARRELRIIADTVVGGRHWFIDSDGVLLAYTSDGVESRFSGESQYLSMPRAVGDTARIDTFTLGVNKGFRQYASFGIVEDLDTLIDVPAGLFHCYTIRSEVGIPGERYTRTTTFYARGIGKVKEVELTGSPIHSNESIWELVEYVLN